MKQNPIEKSNLINDSKTLLRNIRAAVRVSDDECLREVFGDTEYLEYFYCSENRTSNVEKERQI